MNPLRASPSSAAMSFISGRTEPKPSRISAKQPGIFANRPKMYRLSVPVESRYSISSVSAARFKPMRRNISRAAPFPSAAAVISRSSAGLRMSCGAAFILMMPSVSSASPSSSEG